MKDIEELKETITSFWNNTYPTDIDLRDKGLNLDLKRLAKLEARVTKAEEEADYYIGKCKRYESELTYRMESEKKRYERVIELEKELEQVAEVTKKMVAIAAEQSGVTLIRQEIPNIVEKE